MENLGRLIFGKKAPKGKYGGFWPAKPQQGRKIAFSELNFSSYDTKVARKHSP